MSRVLNCLGWILIAAGAMVVCVSYWIPSALLEPLRSALPAGVLIALAGHLLTQGRTASESAEKRSSFYLGACVQAYEEARTLLRDGNNDRITWIAAGRALGHARELTKGVEIEAHRRVLELHQLKYRGFFHEALSKRAAFFYGVEDASCPLNEAAAQSTAPEQRNGRTVSSTVRELSEKSLYAVWQAAQWPDQYIDPLDRKFSQEERGRLLLLFPGLSDYLEHKERYSSASGRIFPRSNEDTG